MEGASYEIAKYQERRSLPYASPAHLVVSPTPHRGIPYVMLGLPVQTCEMIDIEAPIPPHSRAYTYQAEVQRSSDQYGIGQAPTVGIYTGVEGSYGTTL